MVSTCATGRRHYSQESQIDHRTHYTGIVQCYFAKGSDFLTRIIMGTETYMHHSIPERKQTSIKGDIKLSYHCL